MSEISITLPLSTFGDMSVEDVIANVRGLADVQQKVEHERQRANNYRSTMLQWAGHLQSILGQDVDDFQKRQNLRQFANDTTEFANQIERLYDEATASPNS